MLNTNFTYRSSAKMQLRYHFFSLTKILPSCIENIQRELEEKILNKSIVFPYDSIIHSVQLQKRYVPFCVQNLRQLCVYDTKIKVKFETL